MNTRFSRTRVWPTVPWSKVDVQRVVLGDGAEPESELEAIGVLMGKNREWYEEHCVCLIWTDRLLIRPQNANDVMKIFPGLDGRLSMYYSQKHYVQE